MVAMKIHSDLKQLAEHHDDVVAVWELAQRGWTKDAVAHRTAGYRRLHSGVFLMSHAPPTQRQRRRAATLTAAGSVLSHTSGGAVLAFRPYGGRIETITRPGSGGPQRFGDLLVRRSTLLARHTTTWNGLPVTTGARTLWDLTPQLDDRALRKAFREAIRLRVTTALQVQDTLEPFPNRAGSRRLSALIDIYLRLPILRCKSDAEAMALELLDAAGVVIPLVNELFAGEEADLCWPQLRLIIEIDGPDWHRFKDDDARKTAAWRAAGYEVRRIPSGEVFDWPERLLALAPNPR